MDASAELTVQDIAPAVERKVRAPYNLSQMERDKPQLVRLVAWLITIPGMSYTAIAKQAGMAWETVAAIAARDYKVTEWRTIMADKVALVLSAASPGLLQRAAKGQLNAFEFKQLVDAWSQLAAQSTVRTEHTININVTQAEADLMKMIDVPVIRIPLLGNEVREELGMGSHSQKVHALSAEAAPPTVETGPSSGADSEQG